MKILLRIVFVLLLVASFCSASSAFALKVCISDEFGDHYNITIHDYSSASNIKMVTGTVDLLTGSLWNLSGTLNKATKTFFFTSTNSIPTNCSPYADVVYDTMIYIGNFTGLYDFWSNDCGGAGSNQAVGAIGTCQGLGPQLTGQRSSLKSTAGKVKPGLNLEASPNPASDQATILYTLPEKRAIQISVYNHLGQLMKVLVNTSLAAGTYSANWDVTNLENARVPEGLYFISVHTNYGNECRPLMVKE